MTRDPNLVFTGLYCTISGGGGESMTKAQSHAQTMYFALRDLDAAVTDSSKLERELHREKVEGTVFAVIREFLGTVVDPQGSKFDNAEASALQPFVADLGYVCGNPNLNILPIRYTKLDSLLENYPNSNIKTLKPKSRPTLTAEIINVMMRTKRDLFPRLLKESEITDLSERLDLACEDDRRYKNKILQHTFCVRSVNRMAQTKLFDHTSTKTLPTTHDGIIRIIEQIANVYRSEMKKGKLPKNDAAIERHLKNWKPFAAKVWLSSSDEVAKVAPPSPYSMEIERYLHGAKKQLAFYFERGVAGMPSGKEPRGPERNFRPDFLSASGVMVEFKSLPREGLVAFIALPRTFERKKALARLLASHQGKLGLPEISVSIMQDFDQALEVRSLRSTPAESERLVEFVTEFCEELKP